jgi:hypothetical protein
MKIVMTLKSGLIVEFPVESKEAIQEALQQIRAFGKFFCWNEKMWINKKEIASFELVEQPLKSEQTI